MSGVTDDRVSRRRILGTVGGFGAAGVAGCMELLAGETYYCTAIDDEPTETYGDADSPVPYPFDIPEVMSTEDVTPWDVGGRVEFAKRWDDRRGLDTYNHSIRLQVNFTRSQGAVKPRRFTDRDPQGSVLGKRTANGHGVGLIQRDTIDTAADLELLIPSTADGNPVYWDLRVEASAILQGDQHVEDDVLSDDPDQTCQEALRTLGVDTIDSMPVISPAEEETTLSITPPSATVRRGETVDLTVEASGIWGVDLLVDGDGEYSYDGSLSAEGGPLTLTVAPPTGGGGADAVTAGDEDRLRTVNSGGEFSAGTYSVTALAPGTDGLVSESATLTVEPAN